MNQVTINDRAVNVVEYAGQRVVTFKMVDELHQRPEGTARKRFNDNKARLTEGEDYFVRNSDEAREMGFTAPNGLVILTEQGYLMLVKSFTDDMAWDVQKALVRSYFGKQSAQKPKRIRKPSPLSVFKTGQGIAILMGMDATQAGFYGARYCEKKCGENPLEIMGITYQPAVEQDKYLTATQVGEALGLGSGHAAAVAANRLIRSLGFQEKDDRNNWAPTEKGRPFARLDETNRKHAKGTAQAWHWSVRLIDAIRAEQETARAAVPFAKTPEPAS
ncbi:ORF6N domain-containing protein [Acetobacter sp. DsW_063]|uniref:ORF6N domain-containing protein n=1 Tax=Acetobacter sp. DsW_063 TaxID=1514894 RepID=UPI000A3D470A|nr:ORF6N domain-containing protein [Acetobacter sp. DsW_063]OUJ16495.1 hypothetical protein HK28_12525 [Acetobacter sp. DsW_063]